MNGKAVVAGIMPLAAAAMVGGILIATNHTAVAVPHLNHGKAKTVQGILTHKPQMADFAACLGRIREPFIGVAPETRYQGKNIALSTSVHSFTSATRARIRIVEIYSSFPKYPFPVGQARRIEELGAEPLIQLNPRNISMAKFATGAYDPQIRKYAARVREFRCQVVLSFGHEMNGWWYSWGRPDTSPATFIAAWRHLHDVFAAQHVTNVTWSWDPSHDYYGHGASYASEWYPGDAYVDWIGMDGYLGHARTIANVFVPQLTNIRKVTSKPVYLAETGVAAGPNEVWQTKALLGALTKNHLFGLVWFDTNRKQDWRLEGRQAAIAAFRAADAGLQ